MISVDIPVDRTTATYAVLVVNPAAGRHVQRQVDRFVGYLSQWNWYIDIQYTRHPGHAKELASGAARSGSCTVVIAAGGDGTIAEVAEGLAGTTVVLGIMPIGTANVLARELSISFDEFQNARMLAAGHVSTIWPGRLQLDNSNCLFVQMVSVGMDAYIVHHVSRRLKTVIGRAAYAVCALQSLFRYDFRKITVEIDGCFYETSSVIVSKGVFYAGQYVLTSHSLQSERMFSVILFPPGGRWAYLRALYALWRGRLTYCRDVLNLQASSLHISAPARSPIQSDGDARGYTPAIVTIFHDPLHVITPAITTTSL